MTVRLLIPFDASPAALRAVVVASMMARESASVRSTCTCGNSAPGIVNILGSAPVASSSRS